MLKDFKVLNVNFGPQHPAAHGVLRLILEMKGEKVYRADPHIGFLHRGTEKLAESKNFLQNLPYLDRLDYVSMMIQEHAYSLAIEKSENVSVPERAQFIRVIFSELTRILNHLMAVTTHAMDIGALTPFLWAFEEREKIMEFYERVSGARMHAGYIRPGGVASDLPKGLLNDLYMFIKQFVHRVDEIEELLTYNRVWGERLINVGNIDINWIKIWSLSGVLLRSTGVAWDLRHNEPYELYKELNFQSYITEYGDSFDRYLIRMNEMRESVSIIKYCINNIQAGEIKVNDSKFVPSLRTLLKESMENLIDHFKLYSSGFFSKPTVFYTAVEAPKGEFGIFLSTGYSNKPERLKFRAPGFFHLQLIESLSKRLFLSDLVTLVGTLDVVFGEIDR